MEDGNLRRIKGYRNAFYGKVDKPVFEYGYVENGQLMRDVAQVIARRSAMPIRSELSGKPGASTSINPRTMEPETVVVRRLAVRVAGGVVRVFHFDPDGVGDMTPEELDSALANAVSDGTAVRGLTAAEVISARRGEGR